MSRIIRFYNLRAQQLITKSPSAEVSEIGVEVMSPVTYQMQVEELGAEVMSPVSRTVETYEIAAEIASIKSPEVELLFMAMEGVFPSPKAVTSGPSLVLSGTNRLKFISSTNLTLAFSGSSRSVRRQGSDLSLTFTGNFNPRPWKQHDSNLSLALAGNSKAYAPYKFDLTLKFEAPTYSKTVLSLSPIIYYDFESIDGDVVTNKGTLGSSSNATVFGSPLFVATGAAPNDDTSGHIVLDGTNDYLSIPSSSSLNSGGPYLSRSIEFWAKLDGDNNRRTIFHVGDDIRGIHIFNVGNRITAGVYNYTNFDSNFQRFVTANNLELDVWTHVIFTYSYLNSEIKIYINGELAGTAGPTSKLYQQLGPVTIGARRNRARIATGSLSYAGSPIDFFRGAIDFSIYNKTLTAAEVARIFDNSKYDYYGYANEPLPLTLASVVNFNPSFTVKKEFGVELTFGGMSAMGVSKAYIVSTAELELTPAFTYTPKIAIEFPLDLVLTATSDWKHRTDSDLTLTININHYPKASYWQHTSNVELVLDPSSVATYRTRVNSDGLFLSFSGNHKQTVLFDAGAQFLWNVEGDLIFESKFLWNVGDPPVFYWLIEGKCIVPECETVGVGTDCEEPQTFSQIVVARTISEVCAALKETLLAYPHTWPILSIKRFSRPISSIEDQTMIEQGEGTNCNYYEDVEYCEVPECLEYCVEPLPAVKIGAVVVAIEIFESISSQLPLTLSGRSRNDLRKSVPTLNLTIVPQSIAIASNRKNTSSVILQVTGSSTITSTQWNHKSNASIVIASNSRFTAPAWSTKSRLPLIFSGKGNMLQRRMFTSNASIVIAGEFEYLRRKVGIPSGLTLDLAGGSSPKSSYHGVTSTIDLSIEGSSAYVGSGYAHTSTASIVISGSSSTRPAVVSHPAFFLQGTSTITSLPIARPHVSLVFAGSATATSSKWSHTSSLQLEFDSTSPYTSSDKGEMLVEIGAYTDLPYFVLNDITSQSTNEDSFSFLEDADISTACIPCDSLPISISFKHNMFRSNSIYNFFKRNNIAIANEGTLKYHKPTATWRHSSYWKESNAPQSEEWKSIFELSCVSANGAEELSGTYWKLAIWFKKTNLSNGKDFETRIVQLIQSDATCEGGPLDIRLYMNSLSGNLETSLSMYTQTIFNDDIGLFNSVQWQGQQIFFQASSLRLQDFVDHFNYEDVYPNF